MKTYYIKSENPKDHWCFLPVENETVLDLGCGKHRTEQDWLTTPEYFLSKGAKRVIGVDPKDDDILWYKNHLDPKRSTFIKSYVLDILYLKHLLLDFNITSMKMDIEGHEHHFIQSHEYFPLLKYVAIETHSRNLFHNLLIKLIDTDFQIKYICTFYPRVYYDCNVVFAERT